MPVFGPCACCSKYRYVKKNCSHRNILIFLIMFKMEGEILYLAVKIISPNLNNLCSIIVAVVIRQFETEMHCVCAVEKRIMEESRSEIAVFVFANEILWPAAVAGAFSACTPMMSSAVNNLRRSTCHE